MKRGRSDAWAYGQGDACGNTRAKEGPVGGRVATTGGDTWSTERSMAVSGHRTSRSETRMAWWTDAKNAYTRIKEGTQVTTLSSDGSSTSLTLFGPWDRMRVQINDTTRPSSGAAGVRASLNRELTK